MALCYLMFLKEKRYGTIKVRWWADRQPQRIDTDKEDISSPTKFKKAMMLSCTKDAKENRYLVVSYIPGVLLNADMSLIYTCKGKSQNNHKTGSLYGTLQEALLIWKLKKHYRIGDSNSTHLTDL